MNKLLLLINTVKYLKLRQVLWRIYYIVKRKLGVKTKVCLSNYSIGEIEKLENFIPSFDSYITEGNFIFLNQKKEVNNWNDENIDKLWLYNLHYFDFLLQKEPPGLEVIDKWIDENPVGIGNGWEPYTISLRVVNWIKYHFKIKNLNRRQLDSLYLQSQYLSKNIENHILGNHLFENAKSLFLAGLFFQDKKIQTLGFSTLQKEIKEQVLDDGAHFELSPMYHAIILEGMLDLVNFSRAFNYSYPDSWNIIISKMLNFYIGVLHPDDKISYFNDSVLGISKDSNEIFEYANRLGFKNNSVNCSKYFSKSGFICLVDKDFHIIAKAGKIGADYIPGHAHADILSFEMSYGNERVFVNTGISTYEVSERRHLERSTRSHNTVEINQKNQSEVWSSFRVGRRVYPENIEVDIERNYVKGTYTGKQHVRSVELNQDGEVEIKDIFGKDVLTINSYLHLHPDIKVSCISHNEYLLSLNSGKKLLCEIFGSNEIKLEKYYWAEGFNKLTKSQRIVFSGKDNTIIKVYAV